MWVNADFFIFFYFFEATRPSITTLVEEYILDWVYNGRLGREMWVEGSREEGLVFKISIFFFILRMSTLTHPPTTPPPILSRRTIKTCFHGNPTIVPMYVQLCPSSQKPWCQPVCTKQFVPFFSSPSPSPSSLHNGSQVAAELCDLAETLSRPWRDGGPRALPFHGCARGGQPPRTAWGF